MRIREQVYTNTRPVYENIRRIYGEYTNIRRIYEYTENIRIYGEYATIRDQYAGIREQIRDNTQGYARIHTRFPMICRCTSAYGNGWDTPCVYLSTYYQYQATQRACSADIT